jgi:hypothetical protein
MNSFYRSVLAGSLLGGVSLSGFAMLSVDRVHAEVVVVEGDDGAAGANGINPAIPVYSVTMVSQRPLTPAAYIPLPSL